MGSYGVVIFVAAIVAIGVVVWGAFAVRRSMAIAVVAMCSTVLTAGCGWYAFAESRSITWAISYCVVAALSAAVGVRHLLANRSDAQSFPND